jgi:putative ABC transport system permease protein
VKYLGLILKNLFRNKRRTMLTVFSIAVSLFIFSALVSLPTVANQMLADTASSVRIVTRHKSGVTYSLPVAYRQKIAIMPHVVATSTMSWYGGILHDVSDQFPNMAMDHDQADILFPDWKVTAEEWEQFKKLRTACLVGTDTMKRFKLKLGQQIILKGTAYPFNVTLNIVGEMKGGSQRGFLYFRRDYLEEAAGRPGWVNMIWVRTDKSEGMAQLIANIDEQFANSSAETQSESEAAFLGSYLRSYRMMFNLFEILGVIIVITVGLVAANTAAMCPKMGMLSIRMPPEVLVEALIAAAAIGLLSAWIPARAASKMNIVEALRVVA